MTTRKRLVLAAVIAAVSAFGALSANAFWGGGPFGMFPGWGGPWNSPWYGPYGGYPYGAYGYPYGLYGAPYGLGAPYGWGAPLYSYPAYAYPTYSYPATSSSGSDTSK
jgi:hypothetical protein